MSDCLSVLCDYYCTDYCTVLRTQANCLLDMLRQHVIPAAKAAAVDTTLLGQLQDCVGKLQEAQAAVHVAGDLLDVRAERARTMRLETMVEVRAVVDAVEAVVPAHLWTLATYKELLFLDQTMP